MAPRAKSASKNLAAQVADRIRTAIIDGHLSLGEHLSEDSLAAVFDCSRTPVREALNLLHVEGLVYSVPKSGTYIFEPTEADVADLCDFRAVLESSAMDFIGARYATGGIPDTLRVRLAAELDAMRAAIAQSDSAAYGRADTEFHRMLVAESGNQHLIRAYAIILGRIAALRTHLVRNAAGEPARSFSEHEHFVEMILAGRAAELAPELRTHIQRTRENYLSALTARRQQGKESRADRLRRKLMPDQANSLPGRARP